MNEYAIAFDILCVLASWALYRECQSKYKKISVVILQYFTLSFLFYLIPSILKSIPPLEGIGSLISEIRNSNRWIIIISYNVIAVICLIVLVERKSHLAIVALLCTIIVYNIIVSQYYVWFYVSSYVYSARLYVDAVISTLILTYMYALTPYGHRYFTSRMDNNGIFYNLFQSRAGIYSGLLKRI